MGSSPAGERQRLARRVARAVRRLALIVLVAAPACAPAPAPAATAPHVGQWIWTRADVARFDESAVARPALEAGVFIGSIDCDRVARRIRARAGLAPGVVATARVTAVIRLEDGLDGCRVPDDDTHRFDQAVDSAVQVLRRRGAGTAVHTVQLDYDAPQRALAAWAATVRYLAGHALANDTVWVTSIIAHLREPSYGALFRGVVHGHVLQVFDTGEQASEASITEAVRLARRAGLPFRVGLGAFERETRRGRTEHRAWFAAVPRFATVDGYQGVWVFPAGQRWVSIFREST